MRTAADMMASRLFKMMKDIQPGQIVQKKVQEQEKYLNPMEKLMRNIQYDKDQKRKGKGKNKKREDEDDKNVSDDSKEEQKNLRKKRYRTRDRRRKTKAKNSTKKLDSPPPSFKNPIQNNKPDYQKTNEQYLNQSCQIIGSTDQNQYTPYHISNKPTKSSLNNILNEQTISIIHINDSQSNIVNNDNEGNQQILNQQYNQQKQQRQQRRQQRQQHNNRDNYRDRDSYNNNRKNNFSQSYFKTRICPQFVNGACQKGQKCSYAHGEEQLRGREDGHFKTRVCIRYTKGLCSKPKELCRYAHGLADMRVYEAKIKSRQPRVTNFNNKEDANPLFHESYNKNTQKSDNSHNIFKGENKKNMIQNDIRRPQKYQHEDKRQQKSVAKINQQNRTSKKNEQKSKNEPNVMDRRDKYQKNGNSTSQTKSVQQNNPYFINNNLPQTQNSPSNIPNTFGQMPSSLPYQPYEQYQNYPFNPYHMGHFNPNLGNNQYPQPHTPFNHQPQIPYNQPYLPSNNNSSQIITNTPNTSKTNLSSNADNLADDILSSSQNATPQVYNNSYYPKQHFPVSSYPYINPQQQFNHPNFQPFQQQYYYHSFYPNSNSNLNPNPYYMMANNHPSSSNLNLYPPNHDNFNNHSSSSSRGASGVDNPNNNLGSNNSIGNFVHPFQPNLSASMVSSYPYNYNLLPSNFNSGMNALAPNNLNANYLSTSNGSNTNTNLNPSPYNANNLMSNTLSGVGGGNTTNRSSLDNQQQNLPYHRQNSNYSSNQNTVSLKYANGGNGGNKFKSNQ